MREPAIHGGIAGTGIQSEVEIVVSRLVVLTLAWNIFQLVPNPWIEART
jgi:hypothetical protein